MSVQISPDGNVAIIHTTGTIDVKERVSIDTGTVSSPSSVGISIIDNFG